MYIPETWTTISQLKQTQWTLKKTMLSIFPGIRITLKNKISEYATWFTLCELFKMMGRLYL